MRWTVISMPSVAWMRPVMRWAVRVMMVVVPRPICRPPVVVRATIRLIDVGIAIPVAVSRACRIAARQKQDERRDSKQFLHVRSLDVPTSLGFSMCKHGFLQTTASISRSFPLTCSTTSATWRRCAGCIRGMQADGQMAARRQAGLLLQLLPGLHNYGGWQLCPAPAKALRNGFTCPGMRARLPNYRTAALPHCVMFDA